MVPTAQRPKGQPSVAEVFQHLEPISRSSKRWKNLTSSVSYCIANDMMPFSTVNNEAFQMMLHTCESRYIPPDQKMIIQHYMPEMYEREKEKIMDVMGKEVHWLAMTNAGWTARANHSYVTHTVHYIDGFWTLCSHLLDTAELSVDHTGVNLAKHFSGGIFQPTILLLQPQTTPRILCQQFSCIAHTLQCLCSSPEAG